jgi:RNA polymerase sigma factor (sigma-70 family)
MNDFELLRSSAQTRSDETLHAIIERYRDLVYSAALRQLRDPHMADDATQAVFIVLLRKAHALPASTILSAWLLTVTRYVACDALRAEARRKIHERSAAMNQVQQDQRHEEPSPWMQLMPLLDEAVTSLPKKYRDVVVMRYFERQDAEQIAQTLGLSDDAVRKRLSRAVSKLRELLVGQGVTLEAGALVGAIFSNAVKSSPGNAANLIASLAHGNANVPAGALAHGAMRALAVTKLKLAGVIAASICIVSAGSVAAVKIYQVHAPTAPAIVQANPVAPVTQPAAPARPALANSTPLIRAVERADVAEVRRLLESGADPNEVPKRGDKNTALIHAFAVREPMMSQIVALLVEHGADVNVRYTQWGYTPLYMAAARESAGCVRYLLAHGADPKLASKSGKIPLDRAREKGNPEVIRLLEAATQPQTQPAR